MRTLDTHEMVLPEGKLTKETEVDRPAVSTLKGVGLNLAVFPSEALHILQDSVIAKLQACEQRALQVISEQKINNAKMVVQRDFTIDLIKAITDKNERMTKVMAEACRSILELEIPNDEPVDVRIWKLVVDVRLCI